MKNKKDGGRNAENLISGYQRRFLEIFFALATPHGFRSNSKENKKPSFITFLGLKDCGGFKGRREMSRYQVVPFAISANFGCNLSANVDASTDASENPCKNGDFLVGS